MIGAGGQQQWAPKVTGDACRPTPPLQQCHNPNKTPANAVWCMPTICQVNRVGYLPVQPLLPTVRQWQGISHEMSFHATAVNNHAIYVTGHLT